MTMACNFPIAVVSLRELSGTMRGGTMPRWMDTKMADFLDAAGSWVWERVEEDVAITESLLNGAESLIERLTKGDNPS